MTASTHCPARICLITEPQFWSALGAPGRGPGQEALARAKRHGLAGQKTQAYAALADYHRITLADEWVLERDQVRRRYADTPALRKKTDDILRRRINVWAGTVVPFDKEIDWNYENTDKSGFHYLAWLQPAISRFIARGEPVFRQDLMAIVLSYYRARNTLTQTDPRHHLVYYELGARGKTQILLPLYLALLHTGPLPVDVHEAFMKLFLGFARALADAQRGYRGGNWQLVGCSTLLTLARLFPEFREHAKWEKRAVHFLVEHVEKDFYADGGHFERCWGYGHMSLAGLADAYRTARRHGGLGGKDALFLRRIRHAYRWFARTLGPNELKPAYGDCALGSGAGILDAAREFFPPRAPRRLGVNAAASCLLPASQFAIMRNGDKPESAYLNLSWGNISWWHSHMDTLSLNFWAKGRPLLEEMGRFGSYDEPLTILFRAPESHNLLTVDGMHVDNIDHRHRMGREPRWQSSPVCDFFTAWHRAYRAHPLEPQALDIVIRRTVLFVKNPGYAIVLDTAWPENARNGASAFSITQNWHSPFRFRAAGKNRARTLGQAGCLLVFPDEPALRRLETGTDYTAAEAAGDFSRGTWPERHHLRARQWMSAEYRGAIGIATVLFPFTGKEPAVSVSALPLPGVPAWRAAAFEIRFPGGKDRLVLNPERRPGVALAGRAVRGYFSLNSSRKTVA